MTRRNRPDEFSSQVSRPSLPADRVALAASSPTNNGTARLSVAASTAQGYPPLGSLGEARIARHGLSDDLPHGSGRCGVTTDGGGRTVRRLRAHAIGPQRDQHQRELLLIQGRRHLSEVDQTLLPIEVARHAQQQALRRVQARLPVQVDALPGGVESRLCPGPQPGVGGDEEE